MPVVRILHVSDLHEGKIGAETNWRKRRVLGDAWQKNLDALADDERPINLVCFTGDLAFSGDRKQYLRCTTFVNAILEHFHVGLLFSPGATFFQPRQGPPSLAHGGSRGSRTPLLLPSPGKADLFSAPAGPTFFQPRQGRPFFSPGRGGRR